MSQPVFVTEEDLARTFDGGFYDDAFEIVQQYQQAMRYASKHDVKSGATATALDLPRGRLAPWIDDGSKPDAVHAIEAARRYGWLDITYDDAQFTALNALVANVFSGGSIATETYSPSFALNHRKEDSHVFDALDLAGIEYTIVDDRHRRADEVRPSKDATVLGRVLVTLGAPKGAKAKQRLELPAYLESAPHDVKRLFVSCYLENRAVEKGSMLKFREERNDGYIRSLAALIEVVADGPVTISEKNIHISSAATENLGVVI